VGTSFVEIYQNCVIFNDGCFDDVANRKIRDDKTIDLEPGEPLVFGKELDKGLKFNGWGLDACAADEAATWDSGVESTAPAVMMGELANEADMPRPIGIFRQVSAPTFETETERQITMAREIKGDGQLKDLIYAGKTWEVE
jgi:2-oxoglutarate ferredoxin oxidoreductase subunit beta